MKGVFILVDIDFLLILLFLKIMVLDSDVNYVDFEEVVNFVEVYCIFMDFRFFLMKDFRFKVKGNLCIIFYIMGICVEVYNLEVLIFLIWF